MRIKKHVSIMMIIIIIYSVISSVFFIKAEDSSLWIAEPKVNWNRTTGKAWWLKDHKSGEPLGDWIDAANNLNTIYEAKNSMIINDNLASIFVNDKNNTIFVGLKHIDPIIQNHILNIMKPKNEVTVKFILGSASLIELENYEKIILNKIEILKNSDVNIITCAKTVNGTIMLGIENLDQYKLVILKDKLKNEVPLGILEIYNKNNPTLIATQTDKHRPLIEGIQLIASPDAATSGFVVTWNSGAKKGILSVAHFSDLIGEDIYQGGSTSSYLFGDTLLVGQGPKSDSCLIEFRSGILGNPHLYHATELKRITGRRNYNELFIGQTVYKIGVTTGLTSGNILYKGTWQHTSYGLLQNQIEADMYVESGDSGSPVYLQTLLGGKYIYYGCGVLWGKYLANGIFSSLDGIEADLGISLTFTGPWQDDFSDNRRDECVWENVKIGTGMPVETQQKLQANVNAVPGHMGFVTKSSLRIEGGNYIQIDITEFNSLEVMTLMISPTKTTNSDPTSQSNWYRCYRSRSDNKWYVQRRLNGGTIVTLYSTSISYLTGKLKIMVSGSTIYFYDVKNSKQYSCIYSFSGDQYFYIYSSSTVSGTGADYMDNWYYSGLT